MTIPKTGYDSIHDVAAYQRCELYYLDPTIMYDIQDLWEYAIVGRSESERMWRGWVSSLKAVLPQLNG